MFITSRGRLLQLPTGCSSFQDIMSINMINYAIS